MYWTAETGTNLGTYQEGTILDIALPVNTNNIVQISGNIPPGLRLDDTSIVGTPYEVARTTDFTFCLRASGTEDFEDRSYTITIEGADTPVWVTPKGTLQIGPNNQYFILDSQPVDFHLQVIDPDIPTGERLEYWIEDGDGVLPPGVRLLPEGQLVGVVEPLLALDKDAGDGGYDTQGYGAYAFDFSVRSHNGYSSFYYDVELYDYSIRTRVPRKLNRYYEFIVSVSDGDAVEKRKFIIYLVGDDYLRADNTIMQVGTGIFTADNTYVRTPIWLTPADIGIRRANNYITLFFETLDPVNVAGDIGYELRPTNPDGSTSTLPPGMSLDSVDGEIAGRVPYQPAVTKEYKFTLRAIRQGTPEESFKDKTFTVKILGEIESVITWKSPTLLGNINANALSMLKVEADTTLPSNWIYYEIKSGSLPPGLRLDPRGEIIGNVRQFANATEGGLVIFDSSNTTFDAGATTFDRSYTFTIEAKDKLGYSAVTKEFNIVIKDPNGTLYTDLYLKPMLKQSERSIFKSFINNGDIFDVTKLYRPNDPAFGTQRDIKMLLYAGIEKQNLERFVAAAGRNHKRKKYLFGSVETAIAYTPGTDDAIYEVVYVNVVDPDNTGDKKTANSFTNWVQRAITADSVEYSPLMDSSAVGEGDNVIEVTVDSGGVRQVEQRNGGIEVVQRDGTSVIDKFDSNGNLIVEGRSSDISIETKENDSAPFRFRPNGNTIKTDSDLVRVSDTNRRERFISNTRNMRKRLREVGDTDNDFLPLWMRSQQPGTIAYPGFTLCIPLCYCKVGEAVNIKAAIKNSQFDFKKLNLDVDRYLIKGTLEKEDDQYILFTRNESNV
jgi:hypothetical protein